MISGEMNCVHLILFPSMSLTLQAYIIAFDWIIKWKEYNTVLEQLNGDFFISS
jgi:hypothetical protein